MTETKIEYVLPSDEALRQCRREYIKCNSFRCGASFINELMAAFEECAAKIDSLREWKETFKQYP